MCSPWAASAVEAEDEERGDLMKKHVSVWASMALAALVTASVALAQDPTQSGYGGVAGSVQGDVEGGASGGAVGGGGALPFTGLDLMLLVGAGVLLLAAGVALRRVGRASS